MTGGPGDDVTPRHLGVGRSGLRCGASGRCLECFTDDPARIVLARIERLPVLDSQRFGRAVPGDGDLSSQQSSQFAELLRVVGQPTRAEDDRCDDADDDDLLEAQAEHVRLLSVGARWVSLSSPTCLRSWTQATASAARKSRTIGAATKTIESTSAAGVTRAANTTIPTMLTRHAFAIVRAERRPMKLSMTRMTGRTNAMPVASTILNTKSK